MALALRVAALLLSLTEAKPLQPPQPGNRSLPKLVLVFANAIILQRPPVGVAPFALWAPSRYTPARGHPLRLSL
ncbi:hypothetical protein PXNS11_280009 [Stutzerimonas xanthomarina]|nr:hypothetical protein PXNS11_280009 [Stutzerimonas xanthomarina]